ncbi:MAG: zinc ribbon domain-containing protein [Bdellovibrionia bacterium]
MSQQNSASRSLAEQLKALEHLQELDLKIDQLKKNKSALPEALKTLDQSMAKIQANVKTKNAELAEIEKTQKQTLAALDINRDRLTRSTTRLESVQNSQEFTAVNKEIEQLKKQSGTLEEQLKKSNGDMDGVRKVVGDLTAQLEKVQKEREAQANVVSTQSGQIEKDLNTLLSERAQYSSQVDPRTLATYDRVRGARAGLGFVPAVAGRCKGCNMMVPPQLYNEIRKNLQMYSCPSCHRLLFVPGAATEATQNNG